MTSHLLLLVFVFLMKTASSGNIVTHLPGYKDNDQIPFKLETGYVGVGANETAQLFYYFVESEGNPSADPILYWIGGGPGCSGIWGFLYEFGPLNFDLSYKFDGTLPSLVKNKYSWSQFMNIIYIDGPAGTGYSYATTAEGYNTDNFLFAANIEEFIRKWLDSHSSFKNNLIYVSGDGFSGNPIPIFISNVLKANEAGNASYVNVAGYILVSPGTDFDIDMNSRIPFANRMGFIPDRIFKVAEENCNGNYLTPTNDACKTILATINELIGNINTANILEPSCKYAIIPSPSYKTSSGPRYLQEDDDSGSLVQLKLSSDDDDSPMPWCRKYNHEISNVWANRKDVQDALYVREGTKPSGWTLWNTSVDQDSYYKDNINSVVEYHKNFTRTNLKGIIFSGDHDMDIPSIGTQEWIWSLNLPLIQSWKVWSVENETAGYTRKFQDGNFYLTYATVKGAGHFVPEYKPKESYHMIKNWTAGLDL